MFAQEEEFEAVKKWQKYFPNSKVKTAIRIYKDIWLVRLINSESVMPMSVIVRDGQRIEKLDECVSDLITERRTIAKHAPMDWVKTKDRWWHELNEERFEIPDVQDLWGNPNDYLLTTPENEFQQMIYDMKEWIAKNYDRIVGKTQESINEEAFREYLEEHPEDNWD